MSVNQVEGYWLLPADGDRLQPAALAYKFRCASQEQPPAQRQDRQQDREAEFEHVAEKRRAMHAGIVRDRMLPDPDK